MENLAKGKFHILMRIEGCLCIAHLSWDVLLLSTKKRYSSESILVLIY